MAQLLKDPTLSLHRFGSLLWLKFPDLGISTCHKCGQKKKEGGRKGTRSLENIGLGLRRWTCPRWTLDCAWGVSESQGSFTVFSWGMGCPGELINQKNGAVTRRQV